MGLAYYRLGPTVLDRAQTLIEAHEADILGPRARGFWFDYPEEYDYQSAQQIAQKLDEIGKREATERLEISEVQAHALSQLEIDFPRDEQPFPPSLFLCSASAENVRVHLKVARRALGLSAERLGGRFGANVRDPRLRGYMDKLLRNLQIVVPTVWNFFDRAVADNQAVLVVDLRARDVFIPDAAELIGG